MDLYLLIFYFLCYITTHFEQQGYMSCASVNNIIILLLLLSKRPGNAISYCDNNLCFVNKKYL